MPSEPTVEPVRRVRPPENGPERAMLTGMLDFLRDTVVTKVAGLTEEQARSTPVAPSTLTPAGLVKHLTGVERFWFSIDFANADLPWPWPEDDQHGAFALEDGDTLAGLVALYREECDRSNRVVAAAELDDVARGPGMTFTLRYALTHMLEETARHCGHLDLLREGIDGQTGQ
jgi:Protein of unknown function (DUF664)